jgi:hypothetical protein
MFDEFYETQAPYSFRVGQQVREEGLYICVSCGYKKYFREEMQFPGCLECLRKNKRGTFINGMELWEKID